MTRIIEAKDLRIATESFGNADEPPILLIMGVMASMLWWPDEFCRLLASRGRYVIRYDQRDTGLSSRYPQGHPGYTFNDLVDDATRVLDEYEIPGAHIVGMSMGGMIVQRLALRHPQRVLSVTAVSTSPLGHEGAALPPPSPSYLKHSAAGKNIDWAGRDEVIDYMVADAHALSGGHRTIDDDAVRAFVSRDFDRSGGYRSATNHFAIVGHDEDRGRARDIKAPLLVVHGTADPLFSFEHGRALAIAVAGSKLLRIEGGGHELHPDDWRSIIDTIVAHTTGKP